MPLMTLGVGKYRGQTLKQLADELAAKIKHYDIPEDAKVVRAVPGSTYALEIIWVE